MSQDSWTIRKGKMRISWVWKMRNNHYGVRKKARKHVKWGLKQDSAAWKFRTQKSDGNIYSNFEDKFGALYGVHFIHTIYISNLRKSGVQCFKRCANRSWNEEVMAIWSQLHKIEEPFWNETYEFKIQLMNSKSNSKWPQFRIHTLPHWYFTFSTLRVSF